VIEEELFKQSERRVEELQGQGMRALMIWDDSRLEKPESWFSEGLCSVESSKGKRLTKVKRGFYSPPVNRICVPGFHWMAVLVCALGQVPRVCQMSWWTSRGAHQEQGSNIIYRLMKKLHQAACSGVVHVMDRGYATLTILEWLVQFQQDFLIRWKKNHLLLHGDGQTKKTHQLSRLYKSRTYRLVRDKRHKKTKRLGIAWASVHHPELPQKPLSLLIIRDKHNFKSPIYLLCSLPLQNEQLAWEMCFSYMHRWKIEQAFRFNKTELAIESPRLWDWNNRLKFLAIIALIYDFLLSLLQNWKAWVPLFLTNWGHRTGSRYRIASVPAYRLRAAIAIALFFCLAQNSG
jgi:hypothetical protein